MKTQNTQIILVDEHDNPTGTAEKLAAHKAGQRHRAFSVFVYRKQNDMLQLLLQQRHPDKYHCGGLWTNTCCSHPAPDEEVLAAGQRRLQEEMGFQVPLTNVGWFHYVAPFSNGLTENENDHVLVGVDEGQVINPNPTEVAEYRWISVDALKNDLKDNPAQYTPWLDQALMMSLMQ